MEIRPLDRSRLAEATALLQAAYAFDRMDVVAEEKLFGNDGARQGYRLGAFEGETLCGVLGGAGRWIKILAVATERQRRGIASALLTAAALQIKQPFRIADHPGNYLCPGVDARSQAATAFLQARGFHPTGEVENIRAPLEHNPLVDATRLAELRKGAAQAGYECRRATREELPRLVEWIGATFATVWAHEAQRALWGPRAALHVAVHNNSYVAFAAADGNNQGLGWFGPAGTAPEHRGRRLGEGLLVACLLDVAGLPEAGVIAWIGPKPFYQRSVGAVDDRRFVQWDQK